MGFASADLTGYNNTAIFNMPCLLLQFLGMRGSVCPLFPQRRDCWLSMTLLKLRRKDFGRDPRVLH